MHLFIELLVGLLVLGGAVTAIVLLRRLINSIHQPKDS